MSTDKVQLSVALVTRNRPDSLERTLKSLRAQSIQPYEIVISDNSDPNLEPLTVAVAAAHDCRYIVGPKRGLYANRNHVAQACRGSHIRTMDDDHEFPEEHVSRCLAACADDPDSIWIIGEYNPGDEIARQPLICPAQLDPRGFSLPPPDPQRCWAIADGASIYPASLFSQGLRFIEDYKFGAAYLEFGSRLHALGFRIRLLDTTYVLHHYDPSTRSFLSRRIDMSSRFCAMLCHSFIYQPSFRNQALSSLEFLKQTALRPTVASYALYHGLKGFQAQRKRMEKKAATADGRLIGTSAHQNPKVKSGQRNAS